jgi:shikimate kinase
MLTLLLSSGDTAKPCSMILKLKRTPGLYLVGFMGSGKSAVGELVAYELGWTFVDLDEDIQTAEQVTIAEIFDRRGESEFRRIEAEVLAKRVQRVQRGCPMVLALGGGTFSQQRNFDLIAQNGVSVWLDCTFEFAESRIGVDPLPPLSRDRAAMAELFASRREVYRKADFRVDASADAETVSKAILALPIF